MIEGAIGGAVLSGIAWLLSLLARDNYGCGLLAIFLLVAAGAYFGFAVRSQPGGLWALLELAQSVAFGVFGLLGLRGSPFWLAAGWALHPVWDVGVHIPPNNVADSCRLDSDTSHVSGNRIGLDQVITAR